MVLGFSVYLPLQKYMELGREVATWSALWKPYSVRAGLALDDAIDELQCSVDSRKVKADRARLKHCREVEAKIEQSVRLSRELQVELAQLQATRDVLERLVEQYVLFRNIGVGTGLFGLFVSALGFWQWYRKVQIPLDRATLRNRNVLD